MASGPQWVHSSRSGFIDHVMNKKAEIVRVYLRPMQIACYPSWIIACAAATYVNVMVAGKHPAPQWLSMAEAVKHCTEGIGIWQWASNDQRDLTRCGHGLRRGCADRETLGAVSILQARLPELKVRMVNVVDLMKPAAPDGASGMA